MSKTKREVHRIGLLPAIARLVDEEAEEQGRSFNDMAERLISAGLMMAELQRSWSMAQTMLFEDNTK
jgi:hypothetical protein